MIVLEMLGALETLSVDNLHRAQRADSGVLRSGAWLGHTRTSVMPDAPETHPSLTNWPCELTNGPRGTDDDRMP